MRRKHPRQFMITAAVATVSCALVATSAVSASATPSTPPVDQTFPTYKQSELDIPDELGSDIAGSSFVDADGAFHFSNGVASYARTDDGSSWNRTFTADDFGAVAAGIADHSTTKNEADAYYNTKGTLCYKLNRRRGPTGKRIMPSPYNDDHCDIVGVWVDPKTKTWHAVINDEFVFDPLNTDAEPVPDRIATAQHSNRILMATSSDKGASWQVQNEIITPPHQPKDYFRVDDYPGKTFAFGDSGVRFFVDNSSGYFYVYYNYQVRLKSSPFTSVGTWNAVARAPISQKMARGSWNKFYDGGWTQPGIGGLDGSINTPGNLNPDYRPASDRVTWSGTGKDDSALRFVNHTMSPDAPSFTFNTPDGSRYAGNASTGMITAADGSTIDKISYHDPAQDVTVTVATGSDSDGK